MPPLLFEEYKTDGKERDAASLTDFPNYFDSDDEIPFHIDEDIAAASNDIEWTEHVQKRITAESVPQTGSESHQPFPHADPAAVDGVPSAEKINLLRIGSPPMAGDSLETFRQILLHGKHLQMCRNALEEKGFSFVLPQQALMVVTPEQYTDARHALKGVELHPFHLIVAEQFDYLIEEVLADFSYRRRPRVKDGTAGRQELCALPRSAQMEFYEDDIAEEGTSRGLLADKAICLEPSARYPDFIEARTFLCEAPVLKSDGSVSCQSTTEVKVDAQQSSSHYGYHRGTNPRRFA
jgi:hypothetical protein